MQRYVCTQGLSLSFPCGVDRPKLLCRSRILSSLPDLQLVFQVLTNRLRSFMEVTLDFGGSSHVIVRSLHPKYLIAGLLARVPGRWRVMKLWYISPNIQTDSLSAHPNFALQRTCAMSCNFNLVYRTPLQSVPSSPLL
jgi:hypothetical protein